MLFEHCSGSANLAGFRRDAEGRSREKLKDLGGTALWSGSGGFASVLPDGGGSIRLWEDGLVLGQLF